MHFTLEPHTITKDLILSRINEETLMEHYLGVPVQKGLHRSPLRNDVKPTCAFYRNKNGDLIFKDFGSNFSGNFISIVMYKFNCSFYMALQIIANDFGIISRKDIILNKPKIKYSNTKFEETKPAIIQVEIKEFNDYELNYWNSYGISKKTLDKFKVFSCKNVFLNGDIFHLEKSKQLVFGYFGGIKNDVEQWRIYFADRKKYKFISNWRSFQLQGSSQLPKNGGKYLIITKSLKDVMCLYELGNVAIAPVTENIFVTESQYEKLKNKFDHKILFYDNDYPGIKSMNKIRKEFPDLHVMYIPRKYGVKDFSDFRKKYGEKKSIDLIESAKLVISGKEKN